MALFELDDVFTYQDANDIKKLWAGDTAPASPGDGEVWLDTSVTPNRLKRYTAASGWEVICDMTAGEMLTLLKTVDGSGSGLDADTVDGIEAASFIRSDADDTFSGELTSSKTSGAVIKFDNGESMITVHDGSGNLNIKSGVDENHNIIAGDGGAHIKMTQTGVVAISISTQTEGNAFTDDVYLTINSSGVSINDSGVWHAGNDGSGSGLDADKVDGLEAASFIRSDADDIVSGHTEWQDGYQARFGNSADLKIFHDGANTYIDNSTGDLAIRQLGHGKNIYLRAEDSSGTMKTLLTLDPDTDRVTTKLDRASLPDLWRDNYLDLTENPFIQSGWFIHNTAVAHCYFDIAYDSVPSVSVNEYKGATTNIVLPIVYIISTTEFVVRSKQYDGTDWSTNIETRWIAIGQKA